jgi:hypothetical protein
LVAEGWTVAITARDDLAAAAVRLFFALVSLGVKT